MGSEPILLPPGGPPPTSASPPTHSKPLPPPPLPPRKVSEAPAGAVGRAGPTAATPGCPSPPPSRSAHTAVAATAAAAAPLLGALRLLFPASSAPLAPLRAGLSPLCLSFPLTARLCSRNTSPSVAPFQHIRVGEAPNSWLSAPRLGAARPGLGRRLPSARLCLGQEAKALQGWRWGRWGAGGTPVGVGVGRREQALPWLPQSAPHPESHRIPSPYSSSQPCLRPTDIQGMP